MSVEYVRGGIKWVVDFEGKTKKSLPDFLHGETPPDHIGFFNRCKKRGVVKCKLNSIQVPEYDFEIFVFHDGSSRLIDPGSDLVGASHECDVLLIGGVHPREWEAQKVILGYLKRLFFRDGDRADSDDHDPFLKVNVKCIPCVNLPGFLSTLHTQEHDYFSVHERGLPIEPDISYRMTRKYLGDRGVDLNRNHNFFWSHSENAKDPCYEGTHPHSQPETEYIEKLVLSGDYLMAMDLHDYGDGVVDFPLVDPRLVEASSHHEEIKDIQRLVVPLLKAVASDIFFTDKLFHPYNGAGVFSDWATVQGCIGCTIELGPDDEAFDTTGKKAKENIKIFMRRFWGSMVLNYEVMDHTKRLLKHMLRKSKLNELFV